MILTHLVNPQMQLLWQSLVKLSWQCGKKYTISQKILNRSAHRTITPLWREHNAKLGVWMERKLEVGLLVVEMAETKSVEFRKASEYPPELLREKKLNTTGFVEIRVENSIPTIKLESVALPAKKIKDVLRKSGFSNIKI